MVVDARAASQAQSTLPTVNRLFAERAASLPDQVALRRKVNGRWEDITWRGYRDAARKIGLGLLHLGLEKGQAVALLSETRAEWAFADLGILGAGGVTVPIYQSNLRDEIAYILRDSESRFLILEDVRQWAKVRHVVDGLPGLEKLIVIDTGEKPDWKEKLADHPLEHPKLITLDALLELGEQEKPERFDEAARAATLDDVVTYIYTSGTTGEPKGVVLTHGNASAECEALAEMLEVDQRDVTVAFLPLAHVFARVLHWMQLRAGYQVAFAESTAAVIANLREIEPTFFAAVPRVYEKVHAKVTAGLAQKSGFARAYATWAVSNAMQAEELIAAGSGPGALLKAKLLLGGPALKKVAQGLRENAVGHRLKWFISGGAPLAREIGCFFRALGLTIYEGYGLTETTAATHVNTPSAYKLGTVGRAVKGVETRIAEDGEILVRGPVVMREYHGRPEATAEVLKDGWFATGDIGVVDPDGFLRITDRKKDLLITAAGKNIAPQFVENHLKTAPLVSQACLFGDKKHFCVALLTIDEERARKTLEAEGVAPPPTYAELARHPRIKELLAAQVAEKNKTLASYETVKYFDVLTRDFEVGEELTPSLKVKRKKVKEKYGALVDALYAQGERREA